MHCAYNFIKKREPRDFLSPWTPEKGIGVVYIFYTFYTCKVYALQFFRFFSRLYMVARLTPSSLAVFATL